MNLKNFTPKYIKLLKSKDQESTLREASKEWQQPTGENSLNDSGLSQEPAEAGKSNTFLKWEVKRMLARKVYIPSKYHSGMDG